MNRLFFILFLILGFNTPAFAQDETKGAIELTDKPPAVLDVNYQTLEDLGLYANSTEGGLGRELWKDARRSTVMELLDAMPSSARSPVLQRLLFGVLLTEAESEKLNNDIEPVAGRDLLTLRLHKLLEAGAYNKAFNLYAKLEGAPYHEQLARAGVLGMLFNGEKSTACLEANTVKLRFSGIPFWDDLAAYCDASLSSKPDAATLEHLENSKRSILYSIATDGDYKFTYQPETFGKLTPLERALLSAERRLDLSQTIAPSDVPAADIGVLRQQTLSADRSLRLAIEATKWGLMSVAELSSLYRKYEIPEESVGSLDTLVESFRALENTETPGEHWNILKTVLGLGESLGVSALLPFAEYLQRTTPVDPTIGELHTALIVFARTGREPSDSWSNAIKNASDNANTPSDILDRTLISAEILKMPRGSKALEYSALCDNPDEENIHTQELLKNIIENVDKCPLNNDNAATAYDKHYALTLRQAYVMPSASVWDRLLTANQASAVAETILLNIVLFGDQALHDAYPRLLADALHSVEQVDLKDVSRDMAVEAILGDQ